MEKQQKVVGRRPKPKLTIGVDCGALSPKDPRHYGGVYTVVYNLLTELAHFDKRNHYRLYSYRPLERRFLRLFGSRAQNHVLPRIGFKTIWLPVFLQFHKPNVMLATAQAYPRSNIPTLGFVYDAAYLTYPDLYSSKKQRLHKNTQELVKHAKHLITISDASAEQLEKYYKIPDRKISVLYPGVDSQYQIHGPKYVDTKPYFLYVGALKKTKNIPRIISAFAQFLRNYPQGAHLVLVGSDSEYDPGIRKTIKKEHLEKEVIYKGYVPSADLPHYYRGAMALVSPAIVEGFGLPLIEAMACGTPVIAGNNSAMQEVASKAAILVDVTSVSEIAAAMAKITQNKKLRQKLIQLGRKQIKLFTWHRFTKGVLVDIYKHCLPKSKTTVAH